MATPLFFFFFFFFFADQVLAAPRVKPLADLQVRAELALDPAAGPESIAFDSNGGGPYTGVADGSILRWNASARRWDPFSNPPRHGNETCGGPYPQITENVCGRPLGLQFEHSSGDLYIADAYFGLMKVGPDGGTAEPVAFEAEGQPLFFTNGVDIDQKRGTVYLTDSSAHFRRRDFLMLMLTGDATGRLLSYEKGTGEVKVLLRGLAFPNGLAMDKDGEFLLITETTNRRVLRYWLRGPKKGKVDVFADLMGFPDNIKRTERGDFWVALGLGRASAEAEAPVLCPVAVRLAVDGAVEEVMEDCTAPGAISEVEERNGGLWFGSVVRPYVEVYNM
ncbi:protein STRICTOSIDINE SYNTHASE-LIKE 10-like [Wolffia australiana]